MTAVREYPRGADVTASESLRRHAVPISIPGTVRMSRLRDLRPSCCLLLLALVASRAGAFWHEFALASDRTDDPLILEILVNATLDERLDLMEGLGERADPFIGAYIDDSLVRLASRPAEAEHLLRVLLETAFPRDAVPDRLAARVEPNRTALLAAVARLPTFADPQLCAVIVRLIPLLPGGRAELLAIVGRLSDRLAHGDGYLDPREDGLLLDALSAMGDIGSPDFLEASLAVARLSREKTVVDRARAVARMLALAGTGR
jgi:hypothetical protein